MGIIRTPAAHPPQAPLYLSFVKIKRRPPADTLGVAATIRRLSAIIFLLLGAFPPTAHAGAANDPRKDAVAAWTFVQTGAASSAPSLEVVGEVEFVELPSEEKAASVARGGTGWFARLNGGHLDAGKDLNLTGDACTVYLRARDPGGIWNAGLFSKRGRHESINFNLFAGPDRIGGEFHGEALTLGSVGFPKEGTMGTGWHDLVVRYDGQTIDIFCDGQLMAGAPWAGGNLTENAERLLIGAETLNGTPVRPFKGDIEEAVLWSRALKDNEIEGLRSRP